MPLDQNIFKLGPNKRLLTSILGYETNIDISEVVDLSQSIVSLTEKIKKEAKNIKTSDNRVNSEGEDSEKIRNLKNTIKRFNKNIEKVEILANDNIQTKTNNPEITIFNKVKVIVTFINRIKGVSSGNDIIVDYNKLIFNNVETGSIVTLGTALIEEQYKIMSEKISMTTSGSYLELKGTVGTTQKELKDLFNDVLDNKVNNVIIEKATPNRFNEEHEKYRVKVEFKTGTTIPRMADNSKFTVSGLTVITKDNNKISSSVKVLNFIKEQDVETNDYGQLFKKHLDAEPENLTFNKNIIYLLRDKLKHKNITSVELATEEKLEEIKNDINNDTNLTNWLNSIEKISIVNTPNENNKVNITIFFKKSLNENLVNNREEVGLGDEGYKYEVNKLKNVAIYKFSSENIFI